MLELHGRGDIVLKSLNILKGLGALVLGASSAFLMVGCAEPVEDISPGSLSVQWRVLPVGCADAGVESVQVELSNEAHGVISQSFDCESSEGALGEVPAGRYYLNVTGEDQGGRKIFEASPVSDVVIRSGVAESIGSVMELSAAPGRVEAEWRFEDGKVCGAHDITNVRVALFDSFDSFVLESTFGCNEGGGILAEVPAGTYKVWARAEGPDAAYSGVATVGVKRGGYSLSELILAPTQ